MARSITCGGKKYLLKDSTKDKEIAKQLKAKYLSRGFSVRVQKEPASQKGIRPWYKIYTR
jgi:hypothetical protein